VPTEASLAAGLGLIFDMDGVIVDSNPVHREAWSAYNRRFGLETDESMHQRMFGRRNDQIIRDFFGPDLPEEEVIRRGAEKEQLYRDLMSPVLDQYLVNGVRDFLQMYRHLPAGLATNAEPANVEFVLQQAGLRSYFQAVVDGHQVQRPKPDPEIYLHAARLLGIAPVNCIVFEDSYSGVAAAAAAGARVVAIRTTHSEFKNVALTVDHFRSAELGQWLSVQKPL
jgi:beta-phosphoglucomutase